MNSSENELQNAYKIYEECFPNGSSSSRYIKNIEPGGIRRLGDTQLAMANDLCSKLRDDNVPDSKKMEYRNAIKILRDTAKLKNIAD